MLLIPVLISVAILTLLERKLLGIVGFRLGPFKVSIGGILQPVTDAFKLSNKSSNSLFNYSFSYYYLRGFLMLSCSLFLWFLVFSEPSPMSFKFGLLLFIVVLGLNSFNVIFSGWSTLRKYTLIGRIRSVAQLISYEACLYLCLFFPVFCYASFSFSSINFYPIEFLSFFFPLCFYLWLPSMLIELNRTPYDFSEGESELVRGFNTDFGSSIFTLIFLGEYSSILFFSVCSYFFFFFYRGITVLLILVFIIWIRSVLPRFRFDLLIILCWKFYIPFLTVLFIFVFLWAL